MGVYAIWNNKGGVGKSYLTFQIASEYARTHTLRGGFSSLTFAHRRTLLACCSEAWNAVSSD